MKSWGNTTAAGPLSDTGIPLPTATHSGRDIVADIERNRRTPVVVLAPVPQVSTPSPRVQAITRVCGGHYTEGLARGWWSAL